MYKKDGMSDPGIVRQKGFIKLGRLILTLESRSDQRLPRYSRGGLVGGCPWTTQSVEKS